MSTLFAPLRRLRVRLLVLVLIGTIPCAMLVVGAGLERRSADGVHAQETAQRLAALASRELERLVVGAQNLLVGLSLVPEIRNLGPSCSHLVQSVHAQSPEYTVVGVARPDGQYVCSSVPITDPVSLADRRHFRLAVERRGFGVGDFTIGRVTGKASLNVGLAVLDDAGGIQAVVLAALDLNALTCLATRANLPAGSDVTVLDRQGVVLASFPAESAQVGSSLADGDLFRAIQARGGSGSIEATGADGQPRLFAFEPLLRDEPDGPTVTVGIPSRVAYASADDALRWTLLKLGGVALLVLIAAWIGGEAIVLRRVNTMLAATRRLALGDLTARTGLPHASDDLGELGQAFDQMATALQQRDQAHNEIQQSLEESHQRLERESDRLLTLHRMSAALAGEAGTLDTVLDEVLRSAATLTGNCDGATLHLWDAASDSLRRAHAWGVPAHHPNDVAGRGAGLRGQVFASGEPIIVNDYQAWAAALPNARRSNLRATFGVPLRYSGRRIGVLMIGCHALERRPFTSDDVRVVTLFADQAAAAIETARLYATLGEQFARLRELTRLHHLVFSTLDREAVLAEIARAAAELMQVPLAALWTVEHDRGIVRAGAVAGPSVAAGVPQQEIPIGMSAVGLVASTGEALELDDALADERIQFTAWMRSHGLRSLVAIPALDDDGKACAVLVLNGHEPLRLTVADRDLLGSFIAMAAIAIRNASLYEGEAQARQIAELANRSKSELLSRMSHELRTPLNAILGFAQILELSDLAPPHADSVGHILHAGRRLLALIDDVLDISRIDAGRLALSFETIRLSALVSEIVALVQPLAAERSVTIAVDGLRDAAVVVDRQRLQQILLGLLTNAISYNRPGGRVSIACETPSPERVRIAIADTGAGMNADQMARLFDPFDRLGAERTGVPGTGLSLTIARSLAEAMGGQLGASSVVGAGSIFWLDLPRAGECVEPVVAPLAFPDLAASVSVEPRYVLYVEDDRQNALLVRRSLAWRPDVTLLSVENAIDGLTLARDHRPSLILTDLHLPDMSGAEMLARLRDDVSTAEIPVVVVSADADEQQSARLLAAGARAYLTKPFDVRAFLGIVDEILQDTS